MDRERAEKGRRKDLRSEEWIMHKVGMVGCLRRIILNSIPNAEKGRNDNLAPDYRMGGRGRPF